MGSGERKSGSACGKTFYNRIERAQTYLSFKVPLASQSPYARHSSTIMPHSPLRRGLWPLPAYDDTELRPRARMVWGSFPGYNCATSHWSLNALGCDDIISRRLLEIIRRL